jgi:hypothetical protein
MFELAHRFRLPLILFGEGGGGRPGEDWIGPRVAIDTPTFTTLSRLSGLVPMISVVNGRCFAGNAAMIACCDVIIATQGSTLGMGGPAMIEGGGLGVYTPEEVGPMSVSSMRWRSPAWLTQKSGFRSQKSRVLSEAKTTRGALTPRGWYPRPSRQAIARLHEPRAARASKPQTPIANSTHARISIPHAPTGEFACPM